MGTLQLRLFMTYVVIIMVTLGLAALSFFVLLGGYRDSISYGNLEDLGRLVGDQATLEIRRVPAVGEGIPEGPELVVKLRKFLDDREGGGNRTKAVVAVVDGEGRVIESAANPPLTGSPRVHAMESPAAPGSPAHCKVDIEQGADLLCVSTPLSPEVAALFAGSGATAMVVAEPAASLGEVLGDLLPRLLFSGLIGLAAAIVLGFLLSQSVAAPLRNIARAARNVARGNYRQRVPTTGPREVREVAVNFNRMTEEVQRSQQTLRDFLMNISHELKTPLTSIRGFSQAVLDGTIDDSEGIQRSARIISDESTRVLRLVEELLDLSRMEGGQVHMRQEDVALEELFAHVTDVFALRSEETGVALDVTPPLGLRVRGDYDRLEQVLNNLLDNAFRHTPASGRVEVVARRVQQGLIQVAITDTGRGIPPDDLPHLFERFYRATNGRNTRGYGLGLAITKEIVRAHGGDIWATSDPGRGSSFVFTLPSLAPRREATPSAVEPVATRQVERRAADR